MINLSISCGFGEENRYTLENIPASIQLPIYKYDLFEKNKSAIFEQLKRSKIVVRVVHLPLDTFHRDFNDIMKIISLFRYGFNCHKYVIHPNKGIENFINLYKNSGVAAKLCIENFQYRKKKEFRSPLQIIDACLRYGEQFRMTFDTSHSEKIWFDHKIMPYLLKYTSVIHLSNRAPGIGSHMPFNSPKGELNLVAFVRDLKYRYDWHGDIILEYMPEYQDKLRKNYHYLKQLLE